MNLDETLAQFLAAYPHLSSDNQPACTLHAFKCWYWSTKVVNKQEENSDNSKGNTESREEESEEESETKKK